MVKTTLSPLWMHKSIDKIQHTFNKLGVERYYLNITKAIYEKPEVSILLKTEKLKDFPVR